MADFSAGFVFNGIDSIKDLGVKLEKFSLPTAPTMSEISEDIPGKYGNNFEGMNYQSKNITFNIYIDGQNDKHRLDAILQKVRDNLIIFDPRNANKEYPLTFNFDPDVTYMGHFSAMGDPQLINNAWWATVQLTFTMSDPRAYLPQVSLAMSGGGATELDVDGSADADPVLTIIPKRDLKFVGYNLNGEYMGLGEDADDMQNQVQQKYVSVIDDNAGTMTPWTQDANAIAPITTGVTKFTPQGSFASNTDVSSLTVGRQKDGAFDFGKTVENGWYGPLMRYEGLTSSLTDFRVEVMLHHKKYYGIHNLRAMGDVEFLLLDPSGRTFGRMAIKDQSGGHVPIVYFQISKPGSHFGADDGAHDYHTLYYGKGVNFTDKRNQTVKVPYTYKTGKKTRKAYINVENAENTSAITNGWLKFTLERVGNVYTWSIHQYSLYSGEPYYDPSAHLIVSGTYVDVDNEYTSKLGSFGLAFWKDALTEDLHNVPYRNAYLSLTDLQVYKVNDIKNDAPEYVANAGQEIVFDSQNDIVTVDGRQSYPVWVSSYPKLKPGKNMLDIVGDLDDADIWLTYNPRVK